MRDLSWASGGPNALSKYLPELEAMKNEPLDPELVPYVEEGTWGPMLRHPLVYCVPLVLPGQVNRLLKYKQENLAEALEAQDWHTVVFLHERAYRLRALIDYCTGINGKDGEPIPLHLVPEHWDLAVSVWTDSENIQQHETEWRALFQNGDGGLWLGDREAFDALPDPIPAWRGGNVGDWSWSTDRNIAEFFARRHKLYARPAMIPKADVFGYLLGRGESELLVRLTPERKGLVYPKVHLA